MNLTLPIYYTKTYKTKKDKTFLVGLNWYRDANHFIQNEVKKHYHSLVENQKVEESYPGAYSLWIKLYYKNPIADGHNIVAVVEKFVLDALQGCSVTKNDNVRTHLGTFWFVDEQDKDNPRVEITITEATNDGLRKIYENCYSGRSD